MEGRRLNFLIHIALLAIGHAPDEIYNRLIYFKLESGGVFPHRHKMADSDPVSESELSPSWPQPSTNGVMSLGGSKYGSMENSRLI